MGMHLGKLETRYNENMQQENLLAGFVRKKVPRHEMHRELSCSLLRPSKRILRRAVSLGSDSLSLVQRLMRELDRSLVRVVVGEIKILTNTSLFSRPFSISHVPCQCNEAAHILAHSAELLISTVFINFAPNCIRKTLCFKNEEWRPIEDRFEKKAW
jgi:hypothetical protein